MRFRHLPENNRSYFYPGGSLSFIFTDAFGVNKKVMNYGKIRIGHPGQQEMLLHILFIILIIIAYSVIDLQMGITFPFIGLPGYTVCQYT